MIDYLCIAAIYTCVLCRIGYPSTTLPPGYMRKAILICTIPILFRYPYGSEVNFKWKLIEYFAVFQVENPTDESDKGPGTQQSDILVNKPPSERQVELVTLKTITISNIYF